MGSVLYAVAYVRRKASRLSSSDRVDLDALRAAELELAGASPSGRPTDVLPTEEIVAGNDTNHRCYGMRRWRDMFSPRQLLVHGTFVEEFRR